MSSNTKIIYLQPPQRKKPRRKVADQRKDFMDFLRKYKNGWLPFFVAFWLWAITSLIGPFTFGPLVLVATGAAFAVALYQSRYEPPRNVPWFRLDRPVEHWYAATCASIGTVWVLWSTWNPSQKPGLRATAVLFVLVLVCAAPWWNHRRIRGSIPCRFDGLTQPERQKRLAEARMLIREWTAFTSAAHVQGAKLRAITFNRYSMALAVQLRRGATITEFTTLRLAKLESAAADIQGVRAGSARVDRVERHARLALLRFMTTDPHAEPIRNPLTGQGDAERIALGLFETGEEVLFKLVNTVIAGCTGSGKSAFINGLIRALASIPTVAIVGVDMKPGAPELGPWKGSMHALAETPEQAKDLLNRMKAGLEYRGEIMKANGWRKWKPTREHPFIVLIVDEVQELKAHRLATRLDEVAAMIRAYGGCVVIATQYPKATVLSSTLKSNSPQKVGFRVEDPTGDRVVFGEAATRNGWRPSTIDAEREGSFMIRSPRYKSPMLARAYWADDDELAAAQRDLAAFRTQIDSEFWGRLDAGPGLPAVAAGAGTEGEIVDAEIIDDDDPAQLILRALKITCKIGELMKITGKSRPTVNRHLSALRDQGLVENTKRGVWELTERGRAEADPEGDDDT